MLHSSARYDLMRTARYTRSADDDHSSSNIPYPNLEQYQGVRAAVVGPTSLAGRTTIPAAAHVGGGERKKRNRRPTKYNGKSKVLCTASSSDNDGGCRMSDAPPESSRMGIARGAAGGSQQPGGGIALPREEAPQRNGVDTPLNLAGSSNVRTPVGEDTGAPSESVLESEKRIARGKRKASELEESDEEILEERWVRNAPSVPVCHQWAQHLVSMDRHDEAVNNPGAGDCLPYAVADVLKDLGVEGEWTVAGLRTMVCEVMSDTSRTGIWRSEWGGHDDWQTLIQIAGPGGCEYMWMPHIRALAVGLQRCIVRIPMRKGTSGESEEIIRVFHPDPNHPSEEQGLVRPRGNLECCDYYTWPCFLAHWQGLAPDEQNQTAVILYNGVDHYLGTSVRR